MADQKISELPAAASAELTDAFEKTTGGVTSEKVTLSQIQARLADALEAVANKDTDGTLAANSDTKYPSQKAVKTYADTKQAALGFTAANAATTVTVAGTANQVVSSAGAQDLSASRTWTLSLPQNIHTAATPQFARIGLGAAADATFVGLFEADALGATPTNGIQVKNATAAAAGAQQVSPSFYLTGQGWKTTATAASQSVDFRMYVLPVQGSTAPTGTFMLEKSIAGAAFSSVLSVTSAGIVTSVGQGSSTVPLFGESASSSGFSTVNTTFRVIRGGQNIASFLSDGLHVISSAGFRWATTAGSTDDSDTGMVRAAAGVVEINTGTAGTRAWYQWGGEAHLSSNATTVSTTLAALSFNSTAPTLIAGRSYEFTLILFCSNGLAADGIKVDFGGGTCTATTFRAHFTTFGTALAFGGQVTSLTATQGGALLSTDDEMVEVHGFVKCNAAGTFIPRFAKNSDTAGSTLTVYAGSNIIMHDLP